MGKLNTIKLKVKIKFSCLLFIILSASVFAQKEDAFQFQQEMIEKFNDPQRTPLSEKDLAEFKSLDFFEINTAFKVKAHFVRTPAEAPFRMQTTTDRKPVYVKYGELYFTIKGREFKLGVFQNQELISDPEYYNYLFLPFTDITNGETTYSGGRYLDLRMPEGDSIFLDFNKAYNPYCAYNGNYSCPIVPAENHLEIVIPAGVKNFK
ncbi:hypothetical protein SAMN05878281_3367 [Salegentibacter salegens]|uniref:DUF1684 domain-containing protein n=2 Tax=Salegentibacter salegens TaxID=143223 RepID=A0A1M7NQQ9_9FLAO|nr:hypothetical protein LY58_03036 [Salegentibacter salegens]SHN06328.1 hypothetical protein SAMN05878281_3367 [Salegentibacter salegens]